jgi:hypothetical protein
MVKQTNSNIVREIDKLDDSETVAVLDYISNILSTRNVPIQTETQPATGDDLITSLSNQRENIRARQVVEWEKVRRRSFPKAA